MSQLKKTFLFSSSTMYACKFWLFDTPVTKELLDLQKIMNDILKRINKKEYKFDITFITDPAIYYCLCNNWIIVGNSFIKGKYFIDIEGILSNDKNMKYILKMCITEEKDLKQAIQINEKKYILLDCQRQLECLYKMNQDDPKLISIAIKKFHNIIRTLD